MNTNIKNEWIYEQSPAEVWEYLTQPDLIALWLMPNDFKPVRGHEFRFTIKPIPSMDLDGIMHCKVLDIDPPHKLTYSWKAGPGNGVITLDTVCYWTLEPHGNGTRLLLNQTGFTDSNHVIYLSMTTGWDKNVRKMIDHINSLKNQPSK